MSKVAISGAATGTATFTIESPATSTNRTLTLPDEAGTITTSNSPYSTFRNRIINGDMRIAQRGTAAVTTNGALPVDRFFVGNTTDGAYSAQQDSSAPAGFVNSVKVTTTTADGTLTTNQNMRLEQRIEGTNLSDLGWGTADAKTVTLSFWVRSSLTGTFGGVLRNSGASRSYPFTYAISVADTWEYKTITVAGDTSGTWLTTNGVGIAVLFGLGAGPDVSGTANAWAGATYVSATGAVSVIGTLNATWYITGVQLEVGSVATPFERRPYGTELSLCQRYFQIFKGSGTTMARFSVGQAWSSTNTANHNISFIVSMRAAPTLTQSGLQIYSPNIGDKTATVVMGSNPNENGTEMITNSSTGLVGGNMWWITGTDTSSFAAFSSEL